ARHRAADALEIRGDLAADVATIKIVETGMRELFKGCGEIRLFQPCADLRHLAVDEEGFTKADRLVHLRQLRGGELGLAAADHVALAGTLDSSAEQNIERQLAAPSLAGLRARSFGRQRPAGDRTRHR